MLQVLHNIVDNAIKYGDEVRAIAIKAFVEGRSLRVAIADQGVGIPPEEIHRVFEKFFRGRRSSETGSGLGLAITQRIVHDHGGTVSIGRTEPRGTIVTITLPLGARP
jgi:signal transduction histidine kinase